MTDFNRDSERQAAIAAIGRGELQQISHLFDETKQLADAIEELKGQAVSASAATSKSGEPVEDVDIVESDAKAADVRSAVQDLGERFNQLLKSLRDAGVIGE